MTRLVVGVTGHRLNRLPPEEVPRIRKQIAAELRKLQGRRRAADCTLVSGAAEGTDRIAAEVALSLGWRYEALLPFSRTRYLQDFDTPESRQQFEALLQRASRVIEAQAADAFRDHKDAYAANGEALIARSDALITVWDGQEAHGRGGTAEAISKARAQGLHVIWISTEPGAEAGQLPT
jgi:hypothetical protein